MKAELHELKTVQPFFDDVLHERKSFEIRKNDRDFKVGDILKLMEYVDGKETGNCSFNSITYILKDVPEYGLKEGYVILGIR